MKPIVKKILMAAGVVMVTGIVLMGVSTVMGWTENFRVTTHGLELYSEGRNIESGPIELEKVDSIELQVTEGNIYFKESDRYSIEFNYYHISSEPKAASKDGKLFFSDKDVYGHGVGLVWNFGTKTKAAQNQVIIGLPKEAYLEMVSLKSADVDLQLENVACKQLNISGTYGNIKAANLKCDDMEVTWSDGNYSLDQGEIKQMHVKNDYGAVELSNVQCDDLQINSSDGSVKTNAVTFMQGDIKTDYGSVEMSLPGKEEEYTFDLKVVDGSITLNGDMAEEKYQRGVGERMLRVTASDGDVKIQNQ